MPNDRVDKVSRVCRAYIFRKFSDLIPEMSKIELDIIPQVSYFFTAIADDKLLSLISFSSTIDGL